jgi:hypothetical protein
MTNIAPFSLVDSQFGLRFVGMFVVDPRNLFCHAARFFNSDFDSFLHAATAASLMHQPVDERQDDNRRDW